MKIKIPSMISRLSKKSFLKDYRLDDESIEPSIVLNIELVEGLIRNIYHIDGISDIHLKNRVIEKTRCIIKQTILEYNSNCITNTTLENTLQNEWKMVINKIRKSNQFILDLDKENETHLDQLFKEKTHKTIYNWIQYVSTEKELISMTKSELVEVLDFMMGGFGKIVLESRSSSIDFLSEEEMNKSIGLRYNQIKKKYSIIKFLKLIKEIKDLKLIVI